MQRAIHHLLIQSLPRNPLMLQGLVRSWSLLRVVRQQITYKVLCQLGDTLPGVLLELKLPSTDAVVDFGI